MTSTTLRRPITSEDRLRAVNAAPRRHWHHRALRITKGQRSAILAGTAYGRRTCR
ncbi:MAG: hypothetical protein LC798_05470 [Chloroflexi bacterium]|nr:hypothetical protein [Chloroflexota bacterium]